MGDIFRERLPININDILDLQDRPYRLKFVSVSGIEVTQAIQSYHANQHLTDPTDRQPDNAVPLVRDKPAWVRVYVSSLFYSGVTLRGQLKVQRSTGWMPQYVDVATLAPQWPGTVTTAADSYAAERGTLGTTLNFIIPAAEMWGNLRLTAEIWYDAGSAAAPEDIRTISVSANLRQTLALRGVMIGYTGLNAAGTMNLNLGAPTVADLATTAAWSLTTMPVDAQGLFSSAGTLNWTTPLTGVATAPGGCSPQWLALNAAIAGVRTIDGNRTDVIYYGLLPTGIPIANVGGCASSGVTSGSIGGGVTMAHEIGHACGLPHAPCGTPGDPAYPAYEPYDAAGVPNASLGDYGLNINNGALRTPGQKDLMSYCGGDWFSIYNYQRLFDNARLNPVWRTIRFDIPELMDPYLWPWEYIPDPYPEWLPHDWKRMITEPLISIIAVIGPMDQVQVHSVMRLDTSARLDGAVRSDKYAVQLIGHNGEIVSEAPLMRLPSEGCGGGGGCGCGCDGHDNDKGPFLAQAMLPDREPGQALRIVALGPDDKEPHEIWSRHAPKSPPKVEELWVDIDGDAGQAKWAVDQYDDYPLTYTLLFSKDDGRSWNSLASGLTETVARFEASHLPAGELTFRILAHDGFFSAKSDTRGQKMPERAPGLAILHPTPGTAVPQGTPLRLWAAVDLRNGQKVDPEACEWRLDDEPMGTGPDLFVTAPKAGRHVALITVKTRAGFAEAKVEFETYDDAVDQR